MEKILLIGGDSRMKTAKAVFEKSGYETYTLGMFQNDCGDITHADIIVLPVPVTRDGVTVNCALTDRKIELCELNKAKQNALIFSGGAVPDLKRNITNYASLDDYALLNAVPTAEGAIAYAISSTDRTLYRSRILVIGMGRVAKILISRLISFKSRLTVSARSPKDLGLLEALGIDFINTADIVHKADRYDIIFNTVDFPVLDNAENLLDDTLIIDLSSKGCLTNCEKVKGYVKLPGLPGKTAPVTAGEIIAETVLRQIKAKRR